MRNTANSHGTSRSVAEVHDHRAYAWPGDFCAIFNEDMDRLYALALMLTGSHEAAQQCFLDALDDCRAASTVFPEWARSWSRRAVIKSATRLLGHARTNADGAPEAGLQAIANEINAFAGAVLHLGRFDRFVFVISVLEGYSPRECAALMGCSLPEVTQARVRALQGIADAVREVAPAPAPYNSGPRAGHDSVLTLI